MSVHGNMLGAPNYFPNSVTGSAVESTAHTFHEYSGEHALVAKFSTQDEDNFSQVRAFYTQTLDADARERLTDNIAGTLVKASKPVRDRAISNFHQVDAHYGQRVQEKVDAHLEAAKSAMTSRRKRKAAPLNPPRQAFATANPDRPPSVDDEFNSPSDSLLMSALHALRGRLDGKHGSAIPGKSSIVNRDARQEWLNEQLEERKKQRLKGEEESRVKVEATHARLWSPFVREVARTHELNIAWKGDLGYFTWDRVLSLNDLATLRITGHRLSTLPSALAQSLSSLTVLSLIANGLEVLPDNIGELTLLTELDLTKNQLTRLPDSLTTLPCLHFLNLSSNLLKELPEGFGNLLLLDKLWCEHNRLTTLPKSIGRSRARIANFNANRITELPDEIGEMANLTALSVNMNQLHEFPESLSILSSLTSLHASQNQLTHLPHNIGALQSLGELRLDWNFVKQLPFSFRLLTKLRMLCMEKNPLRLPPIEYVIKGVPATLAFMERSLEEFVRSARRKIIERLQEILHFAMKLATLTAATEINNDPVVENRQDEDLGTILALFEPNCERVPPNGGGELLAFFGVVWDEFYTTFLPALERKKAQEDRERPSFKFAEVFSPDEVDDALQKYDDDFGAASMRDFCEFRKCCCIDAVELAQNGVRKRKVCIPGQVPYRCRRMALLVRMQMMTHEEAKDQLASTYLKKKIERLVAKTKRKCVEYINSEAGVTHFEKVAHELAKKLCLKRKRLKKLRTSFAKETQAFAKKKLKLQAKVDAFQKARDARIQELKAKVDKLVKDKAKFENGENGEIGGGGKKDVKRIEKIENKLRKLENELSEEPAEEKKILELEIALEAIESAELKAAVANDQAKSKEERDSDEAEDSDEEDEDDEETGKDEGASGDEDSADSEEDSEDEEEDEPVEPVVVTTAPADDTASGGTKFFQIDMPELKFVDYRKAATRAIERNLADDRIVNEEELVVLFHNSIRDAYVTEKCDRVSQKATFEFLQMRAVLRRWMGLGNRAVFEAWRDLMRANRENAENVRVKKERKKLIEQQNRVLEEQLDRLEANRWARRTDMYTDAVYYEHTVTGETSWDPPKYWDEEQEKQSKSRVPTLKLPPI